MYAIVEIAGQQFKVEKGQKIFVHRQAIQEGETVEFDQVLLVEDGDKISIGEPTVKDVVVEGKIIDNTIRGEKVTVFKKKRKKGYRVKNGHRQDFTQVEIIGIGAKKAKKVVAKKEEKAEEAAPVAEVQAEAEVKKAAPKKAATKKAEGEAAPEAKKPAAKKATTKKGSEE